MFSKITALSYFYILCSLLFALVFSSIFFSSIPTPIENKSRVKDFLRYTTPEGWGFFTRNPRDPNYELFKETADGMEKITVPNASARYLFGADRKSRRIGVEVASLLAKLDSSKWVSFRGTSVNDSLRYFHPIADTIPLARVVNAKYLDKGNYLLVREEMLPWYYFISDNPVNDYSISKIHIQ